MEVVEAIFSRRSIRAFRPDPVPGKVLEKILEIATLAPSWANTQSWEFAVVGGTKLLELKQALAAAVDEIPRPDIPRIKEFPEPYGTRRRILGRKVLEYAFNMSLNRFFIDTTALNFIPRGNRKGVI